MYTVYHYLLQYKADDHMMELLEKAGEKHGFKLNGARRMEISKPSEIPYTCLLRPDGNKDIIPPYTLLQLQFDFNGSDSISHMMQMSMRLGFSLAVAHQRWEDE